MRIKVLKWLGIVLGGEVYFDVPGMINIPTPNLTAGAGGIGASFSDLDFVRAIRHGVAPDGRALFIMLVKAFHHLSDEDLGAVMWSHLQDTI